MRLVLPLLHKIDSCLSCRMRREKELHSGKQTECVINDIALFRPVYHSVRTDNYLSARLSETLQLYLCSEYTNGRSLLAQSGLTRWPMSAMSEKGTKVALTFLIMPS